MQFHEYHSTSSWSLRTGVCTKEELDEVMLYGGDMPADTNNRPEVLQTLYMELLAEQDWIDNGRPYYNIWPGMLDPLLGVAVDKIDPKYLPLPLSTLVLRFPATYADIRTVMIHTTVVEDTITGEKPETVPGWSLFISTEPVTDKCYPILTYSKRLDTPLPTYEDFLELDRRSRERARAKGCSDPYDISTDASRDLIYKALTIAAAIALLRHNPDIIVPKPLSKDEARYEQTGDATLIEKAKRKGCFQFDVGKNIIVQPGVRRPHFSIRHMGRVPNLIPTLRPIKGCIVQRKLATSVPTGFMDDEETSGEPT